MKQVIQLTVLIVILAASFGLKAAKYVVSGAGADVNGTYEEGIPVLWLSIFCKGRQSSHWNNFERTRELILSQCRLISNLSFLICLKNIFYKLNMNKIRKIVLVLSLLLYGLTIKAQNYVVYGAGSPTINGTYFKSDKTYNGYFYYVLEKESGYDYGYQHWLCFENKYSSGQWAIVQMSGDGAGNWSVYTMYYNTALQSTAPPATGWTKTSITSNPAPLVQPEMDRITYSGTVFQESSLNDGTIPNALTITCNNVSGETLLGVNGEDFVLSGKATVSNLPAGLTARITRKDNLTLLVTLTGAATSHNNVDDVSNLKIVFGNSAFSLNSAACVANAYKTDLAINFIQIFNVGSTGDHTTIAEALADCGDGDILNLAAQTFTEAGLEVSKTITIQGQGAKSTIIQAADIPTSATARVLFTDESTKVKITGVTIRNGHAAEGGGILSTSDSLTLQNVSIEANAGGIHLKKGHLSLINSTIIHNTSEDTGAGGIYVDMNTTAAILNSTITYNTGTTGAGIQCNGGKLDIQNSTIAYNQGTGISVINWGALTISGSILGRNNSYDYDITNTVTLTDNGFNIIEKQHSTLPIHSKWHFTQPTDILYNYTKDSTASTQWTKNNALLAIQNLNLSIVPADNSTLNGTQTLSLLAGSFAIGAGVTTVLLQTDQRGYVRKATIDIGAFEYGGTTASKPTVTTTAISTYTSYSATLGGNVTSDGGSSVSEHGIVYNLTGTPSVSDTKMPLGNGTGTFSITAPGLFYGTTYYVRAYAINALGVSYGSVQSFTTSLLPPSFTTTPATTVAYDHRYNYSVNATTVGGQATTLTAPTLPAWLTFSSTLSSTAQSFGNIPSGAQIGGTAGDDDGNTYAITHDGTTIYKIAADGTTTTWKSGLLSGTVNSLLIVNGYIYIPRLNNFLHCITRVSLTDASAAEETFGAFTLNIGSIAYKSGYIYASDFTTGTIYQLNESNKVKKVFLNQSNGLPANGPWGLAFGNDGNLYITSLANNSILMYNGTVVSTVLTGLPDYPYSIQQDLQGNFYIAVGNYGVRKYDKNFSSYQVVSAGSTDYASSLSVNSAGEISYAIFNTNTIYRFQTCSVLKGTPAKSDMGSYPVVVRATNVAGSTDQSFTINVVDKTPPAITGLVPADNAANVSIKPSLSISFDGAVNLGSTGTFKLYNGATLIKSFDLSNATDLSAFELSADQLTLTVTLPSNIGYGIPVSVEISSGFVRDIFGNNFAGITAASGTWNFTTIKDTQTINFPAVTSTTYGDAAFTLGDAATDKGLTVTYIAGDPSIVSISGNQATVLKAGTTTVTASQAGNTTYFAATNAIQTLVVNKKNLTVTADSKTKVYGDANPTLTFSYGGWINSDNETVLDTKPSGSTTISLTTPAGIYSSAISVSGGADDNYSFSYVSGAFLVSKATLTVTADASKTYGDANPLFTFKYSGWKNSDTEPVLTTKPTGSTTVTLTSPAATYTGAITLSGGAATSYSFVYVAGDFTVNKAVLNVKADSQTKVYGDANPALTFTYSGFKNSETEAVLTTKPTISTTVTNTYLANTLEGAITVSGGTAANYTFTYTAGDFTITKAVVTITADAQTKVYGDQNPTLTFRYAGWKNGENESIIYSQPVISTTVTWTSRAGTYTGAITVSGGAAGNPSYTFNYVAADFVVTKAVLTVTARAGTIAYGDQVLPWCDYSGFKFMQGVSSLTTQPTGGSTVALTSSVGTYTGAIIFSGGVADNYSFSYVAADLTITKAVLDVVADFKTKFYGDPNPELTLHYNGFKNSETESVLGTQPVLSTTIAAATASGYYTNAITVSGGSATNYSLNYVSSYFNVTKAALTITAESKTRVYGDLNPTTTLTYSGWKNGENTSVLTYIPTATITGIYGNTSVGTHVGAIAIETIYPANYAVTYIPGDLTITPAPLTVTAVTKTKVYGDANPTLTYNYTGLKNGELESALTTKPFISTNVTVASNAGTYTGAISVSGAASPNYSINYVPADFTVTKVALTVTPAGWNKVYGDPNPSLTATYSGWKNNDDVSELDVKPIISTTVTTSSPVGVYSGSISLSGGSDKNYTFSYKTASVRVTAAPLNVTANSQTKVYGDANQTLTFNYSGWKNSDTEAVLNTKPTASTTVTQTSSVGTYTGSITVSGGFASGNYYFNNYVSANFTVTKAALTVTADAQTKTYGAANPTLTFRYSGWKNSDTESSLTTKPMAGSTVTQTSSVGTYTGDITVSGGVATNYSFTYVAANFTVTKAALTVTADAQTKTYGAANPTMTFTYSGWQNDDNESVIETKPSAATTITTASSAGTYTGAITLSGGVATNYSFNYVPADFTVTKVNPTITTTAITTYNSTSATMGGDVSADGGATVTERGVVYSSSDNTPTIGEAGVTKDANGTTGTGTFSKSITGLSGGITYYVVAYAINSEGTAYGNVNSFTSPLGKPSLTTTGSANVSAVSADIAGNITSIGSGNATVRGICYNTSGTPTVGDPKSETSGNYGTGAFTLNLTGLTDSTTYYARAYATNSGGTGYGDQVSFTTLTTPANPTSVAATYSILCQGASTQLTANDALGTVYWYTGSCGGTQVTTGNPVTVTPLVNTTYYALNFNNGAFSAGCASIGIVVNPRPTVADLQASGTGIKWYLTQTGGTALVTSTQLVNGQHYWASQTINGLESMARFEVEVTMTNP